MTLVNIKFIQWPKVQSGKNWFEIFVSRMALATYKFDTTTLFQNRFQEYFQIHLCYSTEYLFATNPIFTVFIWIRLKIKI